MYSSNLEKEPKRERERRKRNKVTERVCFIQVVVFVGLFLSSIFTDHGSSREITSRRERERRRRKKERKRGRGALMTSAAVTIMKSIVKIKMSKMIT